MGRETVSGLAGSVADAGFGSAFFRSGFEVSSGRRSDCISPEKPCAGGTGFAAPAISTAGLITIGVACEGDERAEKPGVDTPQQMQISRHSAPYGIQWLSRRMRAKYLPNANE